MVSRRAPKPKAKKADVVDAEIVEETSSGEHRAPADAGELAEAAEPSEPADPTEVLDPSDMPVEDDDAAAAPTSALSIIERAPAGRSRDSMAAYMAEVTRHPLLTREEETALARRYRETGDVNAAYRLVAANLRLVVKLAHEYHRNPMALLDLVQEGNIGLMQAVKKYDPDRGVKLSSYAAWWIRAYIFRYIMDNWKMVKLGTTEAQRKLFFKLHQEQERLVQAGLEATPKLLAERLNVSEQDVIDMDQRLGHDELSIDAPVRGADGEQVRAERLLPAAAGGAEEDFGAAELKAVFKNHLEAFAQTLKEKERYIFEKRLMADEPLTLQDIGAHYGVSRERARQLEAALMARMREYMREKIPDFEMMAEPEPDEKDVNPSLRRGLPRSGR